jgi:acetyltransferase-like isoleucine patch superfamily enzyme
MQKESINKLQKVNKPYYKVSKTFNSQIESGKTRSSENAFRFLVRKLFNFVLERLAYNCPINSWRIRFHKWRGVCIGENVMIGLQVTLDHSYPEYISIEDNVSLAGNNYVLAHSNPYPHFKNALESFVAPVIIKEGAWIGISAMILPDVTIGENSVIAAGSVVSKDIPKLVIAGGMPAKIIKKIDLGKI